MPSDIRRLLLQHFIWSSTASGSTVASAPTSTSGGPTCHYDIAREVDIEDLWVFPKIMVPPNHPF